MTPTLELRGAAQRYRTRPVLAPTDLAVEAGEILGVCGPSGAGKSTLLRLLAAIEPPDRGEVLLGGVPAWRRHLGRLGARPPRPGYVMPVFQHPRESLTSHWPVWRSITEPLTATGRLRPPVRRERAGELLDAVGLGRLDIRARPHELSVGQCQRVAVGRALAASPAAIVADEPTSALDTTTTATILRLFRDVADRGTSLVIVSHDENLLSVLADRIVRLNEGVLTNLDQRPAG